MGDAVPFTTGLCVGVAAVSFGARVGVCVIAGLLVPVGFTAGAWVDVAIGGKVGATVGFWLVPPWACR
jgi:hypothetical protein